MQSQVVAGLKGSAVNPQAVVTVVDKPTSAVMLSGAVKNPGKIALTARQERVLDALNQAGGPTVAAGAATVTVVRGSQRASAPLDRVMREDRQNIRLSPDDQVMIDGDAASYTALGAFKSAGEFQFEAGKLTLAQAVGRAGGCWMTAQMRAMSMSSAMRLFRFPPQGCRARKARSRRRRACGP